MLCVALFYGFWQMCDDMCLSLQNHTELLFHCCKESLVFYPYIPSSLLPTSLVAPTHLHCWFSPSPLPFRVSVPRGSQSCVLFYFPSMLIFFVTSSGSMALNVIYSHNLRNDICSPELQLVFLIAYLITPTWMSHSQLKQNLSEATPIWPPRPASLTVFLFSFRDLIFEKRV